MFVFQEQPSNSTCHQFSSFVQTKYTEDLSHLELFICPEELQLSCFGAYQDVEEDVCSLKGRSCATMSRRDKVKVMSGER